MDEGGEEMERKRLRVDGSVVCTGIEQATTRSEEPVLCLIRPETIRFVAVSGLRLVVSWQTKLRQAAPGNLAFLIPPFVGGLLSSDVVCEQVEVEFELQGEHVLAKVADHLGSYDIHWKSDLSTFPAPEAFGQILKVPDELMQVPYLKISDVAHQAVAKLIQIHSDEQVSPTKLAVLIDLDFGGLRVDGQEIVESSSRSYYFDPRLVVRALEFMKARRLSVGITSLAPNRGYLSLLAEQSDWLVHCSLLSIGKETQQLYPLPPGRNR
jgi:hypothetical protein